MKLFFLDSASVQVAIPYMKTCTKENCEMIVIGQKREAARDARTQYWFVWCVFWKELILAASSVFTELAPRYRLKAKYQPNV